jgi:hypothetical protein
VRPSSERRCAHAEIGSPVRDATYKTRDEWQRVKRIASDSQGSDPLTQVDSRGLTPDRTGRVAVAVVGSEGRGSSGCYDTSPSDAQVAFVAAAVVLLALPLLIVWTLFAVWVVLVLAVVLVFAVRFIRRSA